MSGSPVLPVPVQSKFPVWLIQLFTTPPFHLICNFFGILYSSVFSHFNITAF